MLSDVIEIARACGDRLMLLREQGIVDGKWVGSQFKARADVIAHDFLDSRLRKLCDIPIISEEDNYLPSIRPSRYWIIDPIDGTASFVNGYSGFVTQLALIEDGKPILSVVFAPALNLLYRSELNGGAYCNDKKLSVSNNPVPKKLIDNYPEPRGITKALYNELSFDGYVECGSISLKICRIADGTADVFFKDVIVRDWDLAPPHLILKESGGSLSSLDGDINYKGSFEHRGLIASYGGFTHEIHEWYSNNSPL